ncbi:Cationic amino acid transporter 1 [Dendrobium catenatum]|uniref:Cationic amino acid transporter 1 n=1 Tax=Dendrobium catenatum TaxID=906689 RepID=A0A2I0X8D5_9ASPA|nr:Cationic amino acid transporter 1 [Dendrobium catenatum]
MAEETKNPAKDILIGLVSAMSITTSCFCLLALVLCLMQPYTKIDPDAPFSVAFSNVGLHDTRSIALRALTRLSVVILLT